MEQERGMTGLTVTDLLQSGPWPAPPKVGSSTHRPRPLRRIVET
jgi:hypothetical protein